MCQPNWRLHRLGRHLALLQLDHRLAELGHVGIGAWRSRGRRRSRRSPDPCEFFFARSSNLAPPLICAISALASSSFSTRMWRARYSVPLAWALNLSYSALASASVTGFFFLVVLEQLADQDALARQFHLRAVVGRGGDASASRPPARRSRAARPGRAPGLRSPARPCWPARAACCSSAVDARLRHGLAVDDGDVLRLGRDGQQQGGTSGQRMRRARPGIRLHVWVVFQAWRSPHGATARRCRPWARGQDRSGSVGFRARRARAPRWPAHGCRRASASAGHHTRGDVAPRGCRPAKRALAMRTLKCRPSRAPAWPGVQVAVVLHLQQRGLQVVAQARLRWPRG